MRIDKSKLRTMVVGINDHVAQQYSSSLLAQKLANGKHKYRRLETFTGFDIVLPYFTESTACYKVVFSYQSEPAQIWWDASIVNIHTVREQQVSMFA